MAIDKKMGMMDFYGVMNMLIKLDCDESYSSINILKVIEFLHIEQYFFKISKDNFKEFKKSRYKEQPLPQGLGAAPKEHTPHRQLHTPTLLQSPALSLTSKKFEAIRHESQLSTSLPETDFSCFLQTQRVKGPFSQSQLATCSSALHALYP